MNLALLMKGFFMVILVTVALRELRSLKDTANEAKTKLTGAGATVELQ